MTKSAPTACVLLIGNEILSGRTQDINLNFIAKKLGVHGVPVRECRVIPDVPETIIATVNECRARYTYVITTGGIGPTHDDITSECIAAAFGVPLLRHPEAYAILEAHYQRQGTAINGARARMANVPEGGILIHNPVTFAPGYKIENVFVLAGVPKIMQGMFENVLPHIEQGAPVVSVSVTCLLREGDIADGLAAIQKDFPQLDIGSYPFESEGKYGTSLVAKGVDAEAVKGAEAAITAMVLRLGAVPEVA